LELLFAHFILWGSASLTRLLSTPLTRAGLSGMIAPSRPLPSSNKQGFRGQDTRRFLGFVSRLTSQGSGGIAGGGLFEFDPKVARRASSLAIVYAMEVLLSNISFTYTQFPVYIISRIGIIPLTLGFSTYLNGASHSVNVLSAALSGMLNLIIATYRPSSGLGLRIPWESVIAGIASSVFAALYPVQLQNTFKKLLTPIILQINADAGSTPFYSSGPSDAWGSKEESRAAWQLLHYTSLISVIIITPIALISGELGHILRNCYFLDGIFFWFMVCCCALGTWAMFIGAFLLTRATSAATTNFLFIPRSAFMISVLKSFRRPTYSWVGITMCWVSCLWFLYTRRKEGRMSEKPRARI
jgi:hypothetical protein